MSRSRSIAQHWLRLPESAARAERARCPHLCVKKNGIESLNSEVGRANILLHLPPLHIEWPRPLFGCNILMTATFREGVEPDAKRCGSSFLMY